MSAWNETVWFSFGVGAALKGTAVLGAASAAAWLWRGRSAAARHLVWVAAAVALLALPFLSASLPAVPVPGAKALLPFNTGVMFRTTATAGSDAPVAGTAASATRTAQPAAARSWDWTLILLLLWSAGTLAAQARMLFAQAALWRMRRAAKPFSDADLADRLAGLLGIGHRVDVLETAPGSMPMTFGLLRPTVFMPADAMEWSEERRRVVLLHELAHVKRGDAATHLAARMALSFYWWNPLAWSAWRQFLKERERATDDLVLNAGARASDYAGHLLEIARSLRPAPATAWVAVAMARRSQLEGRLLAILDTRANRGAPGRAALLAVALAAVALVAPLASIQAQEQSQAIPPDVDATIQVALSQKNHEILDHAASAFIDVRKYEIAQKLLETSLQVREQVSGQKSVDYGMGLTKLGDLAYRRNAMADARDFYSRAATVLAGHSEAAVALEQMGKLEFFRKDWEPAAGDFQQAYDADPSGATAGPALTWLALARQRQEGINGQAESLYQRALAAEKPGSSEAALTLELYAQLLKEQGRGPESDSTKQRADEIRKALVRAVPERPRNVKTPAVQWSTTSALKIGNGVTAPVLVSKIEPEYTQEARAAKYQGAVILYIEVGTDGFAHNMRVVRSLGLGLDEEAVEAVSQWRFKPGTKDGVPVTVQATIEINFRLM